VPVFFEFHALSVMVLMTLVHGLRAQKESARDQRPETPVFLPRYSREMAG
jgi:hypothetical protein